MKSMALPLLMIFAVVWPTPTAQPEHRRFAIGVEYMTPGMAETYARAGVTWAKSTAIRWGEVEPEPPKNGRHTYRWAEADRLILEYQRAGFRHFHVYLQCKNPWASSKPVKPIGGGSWLPKPEYMHDYRAFLTALVQRYNPQSPSHLVGLLYPVEYWEIESEWGTGFWQGTLEEYLQLLRVAYPTIKTANPNAKIILIGFFLAGVFENNPDPAQLPQIIRSLPQGRRAVSARYLEDIRRLLDHPELFDVVEFHSLSDWSEITGMTRFLKQTMRQRGYEKPIWVGDVNYTASPMVFWGIPVPPYTNAQKPAITATLKALSNPLHPRHAECMRWFRAEQARGLVKKTVLAMAEGCAGINLGNMTDWGLFSLVPSITGTVGFQGMIDVSGRPPRPGAPRPAYQALALIVQKLGDFTAARPLEAGRGVYAFQFTVRGRETVVAWYDDGRRYLPGDREPETTADLKLPAGRYTLVSTPIGPDTPDPRTVQAPDGTVRLRLGLTPVFLSRVQ